MKKELHQTAGSPEVAWEIARRLQLKGHKTKVERFCSYCGTQPKTRKKIPSWHTYAVFVISEYEDDKNKN